MDREKQWIGRPTQNQKGVKGFQPIGLENKKDLRQIVRLSHRQMRVINQFSKKMGLTKADLFRTALFEYLNNHNVNTEGELILDKDQMILFENE